MCWYNIVVKYLNNFFFFLCNTTVNMHNIMITIAITSTPSTDPTTNKLVPADRRLTVGVIVIVLVVITTVLLKKIKTRHANCNFTRY